MNSGSQLVLVIALVCVILFTVLLLALCMACSTKALSNLGPAAPETLLLLPSPFFPLWWFNTISQPLQGSTEQATVATPVPVIAAATSGGPAVKNQDADMTPGPVTAAATSGFLFDTWNALSPYINGVFARRQQSPSTSNTNSSVSSDAASLMHLDDLNPIAAATPGPTEPADAMTPLVGTSNPLPPQAIPQYLPASREEGSFPARFMWVPRGSNPVEVGASDQQQTGSVAPAVQAPILKNWIGGLFGALLDKALPGGP
ncbi:hypothetical protein N7486_002830 [Penicillium sp. IBT 16267x]|nr:hypothetical protein N7486_002830 [Penicillium sp. IBT 16267x]